MTAPGPRRRATGRVTLADVAAVAGVSPITASRALRGERSVAPELVARVQAAASKLGYVPDPAARALASRQGSQVALLVPGLSNPLFADLVDAAQRELRAAGYQALIGLTRDDDDVERQVLEEQLLQRPAGLVVTGFGRTPAVRRRLAHVDVPCVHVMQTSRELGVCSVGLSQEDAAAALTRHLIERGYRRIAFAAARLDPCTMQRLDGWRSATGAAGRHEPALEWLDAAPSSLALGADLLQRILGGQPPADAAVFASDVLAQGALLAAWRLQVQVPQRIAIAGFDDLPGSDLMVPPLTTVRTPRAAIGEHAARMLIARLRGEVPEPACVDLGFRLVVRTST
jgi:LacI family gluconate utilization system Gnt-I transcriptional repressor